MEGLIQELIALLEKEADEYGLLLELILKERSHLMKMQIEHVQIITRKKEKVLVSIECLERKRAALVSEFSKETGIENDNLSISLLADLMSPESFKKLSNVQVRLGSLLAEVKEGNSINSILIEKSEKFFSRCINMINTICSTVPVYMSSGEIKSDENKSGSLVCRKG